ncbi:hypothetical protein KSS94_10475 [Pseudomonas fakonensis]|uniref:Secreted protein n=1 Tax=Pseudomonas fakonensis TaxID=2842355 RepID=A0ABX8NBX8_9PSED|nr:hypothetical protein [Pseudomonas fakonensis]QXH53504.1 hypothetical protein KSS94_10475 [Pseudomonas fakonensis]
MLHRAFTLLGVSTLPGLTAHHLRAFAHRATPQADAQQTCATRFSKGIAPVMNMTNAFVKVIQFHSKRPLPTLRLNY